MAQQLATKKNAKTSTSYSEIDDIKNDIQSLRSNIVELTSHLKADGAKQTQALKEKAVDTYEGAVSQGKEQIKNVEKKVQQKPLESVAIAFATGVVASMLLGRR